MRVVLLLKVAFPSSPEQMSEVNRDDCNSDKDKGDLFDNYCSKELFIVFEKGLKEEGGALKGLVVPLSN
jgi:hypothetical protein